jgi:hypothetical protein
MMCRIELFGTKVIPLVRDMVSQPASTLPSPSHQTAANASDERDDGLRRA